ncbi:glycosyltransferase family 4 protein [Anabaena sp. PCC 7108]|uniref:glycosyltransferase family 4 protein n=1 Tax=Anabaena sp. PCC 7108 TaxID=163908 RepID=UPI00034D9E45|nr:glycosyltransferase family 4 protein [Anabaena sp. PCC 7108]
MPNTRKILSIGHSYVVNLNRRLVNEIARLGQDEWEVTAVAPAFMHGDLRPMHLETDPNEICHLEPVSVYNSQRIHIMTYGWQLREIMQQRWDLIHCWEEPYIFAGAQVAWWKTEKTPLVYSTFQNKSKQYPPPFNWIEQYAMSRATGWIAFGQTVTEALKSRPGYSHPMRVITPGVDINHFYPSIDAKYQIRRFLGWEAQEIPVVGYLGRFVPDKGLDLLMKVLDRLETPWRALFVGTGVMESSMQTWAKRYPKQVQICTDVKHNEVPQYLNAMDILVAPSQTMPNWREQFGRMLIEAFACGVPVIGSDSGEIPYVIEDAGVVVGEKDENGWVEAISDLLNSPSMRQELTQKGLERAHKLYAWSSVAQQHLLFFNELLENRSS